jgi:uncharacterized protein (DUF2336 family)
VLAVARRKAGQLPVVQSTVIAVDQGDLGQLLQLSRKKRAAARATLAAAIADLFRAKGRALSDRERFLMTDILRQLVKEVETATRRALSKRLSEDPASGRDLIPALAREDADVALPILRRSEVLQDVELIETVKHRALEHQLTMTTHKQLNGAASATLGDGAHPSVIHALLEHPEPAVRSATMAYLVEQTKRVDTFQNPRLPCGELSPELARRVCWWVSAALRQHVIERFAIDPIRLDQAIEASVAEVVPRDKASATPAATLARRLGASGEISADLLIDALRQGEVELFRSLFARLTGLRQTLVNRLIFEPGGEGLAIACKAVGLNAAEFLAIFALTRGARPDGGEPPCVDAFFATIERRAAQRTLKSWRRNPAYQQAIWQVETTSRATARA